MISRMAAIVLAVLAMQSALTPAQAQPKRAAADNGQIFLPRERIGFDYPKEALEKGLTGYCDIQFEVDAQGLPQKIATNCSDEIFSEPTRTTLTKWRYEPFAGQDRPTVLVMRMLFAASKSVGMELAKKPWRAAVMPQTMFADGRYIGAGEDTTPWNGPVLGVTGAFQDEQRRIRMAREAAAAAAAQKTAPRQASAAAPQPAPSSDNFQRLGAGYTVALGPQFKAQLTNVAAQGRFGYCVVTFDITPQGKAGNAKPVCSDSRMQSAALASIQDAAFRADPGNVGPFEIKVPFFEPFYKVQDKPKISLDTPLRSKLWKKYSYQPSLSQYADVAFDRIDGMHWRLPYKIRGHVDKVLGPLSKAQTRQDLVRASVRLVGISYRTKGDLWRFAVDGCNGQTAIYSIREDTGVTTRKGKRTAKALKKLGKHIEQNGDEIRAFIARQTHCSRPELEANFTARELLTGNIEPVPFFDSASKGRGLGKRTFAKYVMNESLGEMLNSIEDSEQMVRNYLGAEINWRDFVVYRYLRNLEIAMANDSFPAEFVSDKRRIARSLPQFRFGVSGLLAEGADPLLIQRAVELGLFDATALLSSSPSIAKRLAGKGGDHAAVLAALQGDLQGGRKLTLTEVRLAARSGNYDLLKKARSQGFRFEKRSGAKPYNLLGEALARGDDRMARFLARYVNVNEPIILDGRRSTLAHAMTPSMINHDGKMLQRKLGTHSYTLSEDSATRALGMLFSWGANPEASDVDGRTFEQAYEHRFWRNEDQIEQYYRMKDQRNAEVRARNQQAQREAQASFNRLMSAADQSQRQLDQSTRSFDNSMKPRAQRRMEEYINSIRLIRRERKLDYSSQSAAIRKPDSSKPRETARASNGSSSGTTKPAECDNSLGMCAIPD